MSNIITTLEFASYRNISQKLDTGKIEESISLAQQSDLLQILGDFYFDVLKNQDETTYTDLMEGSGFTYNGYAYEHAGIKRLLADYAYARFASAGNINFTPFGIHKKLSNESEPIDRNTVNDIAKQAQIDAGLKFQFIELYILSEPILFERYGKDKQQGTNFASQRFSKL
jgi:hypothetical protein